MIDFIMKQHRRVEKRSAFHQSARLFAYHIGTAGIVSTERRWMALRFLGAPICLLLSSCSVGLEQLRPTYNEAALIDATDRVHVEQQLGKPQSIQSLIGGETEAIYHTSRMSRAAKHNLIAGHLLADMLTLGLAELTKPAYIRENEATVFVIDYTSADKIKHIKRSCENDNNVSRMPSWSMGIGQACINGAVPL